MPMQMQARLQKLPRQLTTAVKKPPRNRRLPLLLPKIRAKQQPLPQVQPPRLLRVSSVKRTAKLPTQTLVKQ
ncbi:hypothetical protein EFR65_08720 [Lactobacillus delbrueckii subsp. lactis]|nr:hypothetical protein [Lactobacillus delbrueckii subsp. lactis]